jgi:hypothetical protein
MQIEIGSLFASMKQGFLSDATDIAIPLDINCVSSTRKPPFYV